MGDVADAVTDVTDKIVLERVDAILHQRVRRKRKLDACERVRVLVVEDNQADAELLFDLLEGSDNIEFDHDLVGDVKHACVALRERRYDCVVLDLALPDAKGLEGLMALQERKEDVPIVVLTGIGGSDGNEAIRRGAQDYLNKGSITASLLERALRYAIERHSHQARLVMANIELERFAGAVAHDLTKPLSAIAGYAQTLERLVPSLDDNARMCVERIVDNVDRAANMIRDLLAHGVAVAAGENKAAVDLNHVLQWVKQAMADDIDRTRATIHCANLPTIWASEIAMRQLLLCLVDNALKYKADEAPRVEIRSKRAPDSWLLIIDDNGRGIAADERERVLDAGERLIPDIPGSGLGLATCMTIARAHSGSITLTDSPVGGTRVVVGLPERRRQH